MYQTVFYLRFLSNIINLGYSNII